MPIINRMAELHEQATEWRRDIHRVPELLYEVHQTAEKVTRLLTEFGCDEVVGGIGRTGVVGVINGKNAENGSVIGLRADMDALPMQENSGKPWASTVPGMMHACGHDGHTAMLLSAARYLAETRNFSGKAVVIFQPAEEGGAGARAMVQDGLIDRFGIQEVYGMHNLPGMPVGHFATCPGPLLASTNEFDIVFTGKGCHAAMPHWGNDPIVAASQCVTALQTIVSRGINPLRSLVVSITQFHAGSSHNIIPGEAKINGTIRCLDADTRALAIKRMTDIAESIAVAHELTVDVHINSGYPVTVNHEEQTDKALAVARQVGGVDAVDGSFEPLLGGEDFSFMLEARPGAFIFIGNGDTAVLHNEAYDFNDDAIPHGASYWAKLVETLQPA